MSIKPLAIALLAVSLVGNVFLAFYCIRAQQEITRDREIVAARSFNGKVVEFNRLVIEKVLRAGGEVSFDDRLTLENAVRDTKDQELLAQWNKFTAAKDEVTAQQEMKNLLSLLAEKIQSGN